MPQKPTHKATGQPVPAELGGKWIAWAADHARIVAYSDRLSDLWKIVSDQGISDPVFEKVPAADVRLVGVQ